MKKITFDLYEFDELSDSARKVATAEHQFDFVDCAIFDDIYSVIDEIDCDYSRKSNSQCSFVELFPNYNSPLCVDYCGRALMHYFYFKFMAGHDCIDAIYSCVYNDLCELVDGHNGNAVDYSHLVRLFEKYIERAFEDEEEYVCSDDFVAEQLIYNNYLFFEDGQTFEAKKGGEIIA